MFGSSDSSSDDSIPSIAVLRKSENVQIVVDKKIAKLETTNKPQGNKKFLISKLGEQ